MIIKQAGGVRSRLAVAQNSQQDQVCVIAAAGSRGNQSNIVQVCSSSLRETRRNDATGANRGLMVVVEFLF